MAFKIFPVLTTERLIIDRLTKSDRTSIYKIFSDPRVIENYDVERFKDISEADNLVDYFDARFESFTGIRWAARKKGSGELIGTAGFTTWNEFDHSVNLGYDLAFEYWGQGYATEMLAVILDYAFSEGFPFFVNRIEASILPHNEASIKLVKRFGFQYEGTLRDKCFWNGAFHSMDLYSLIRRDLPGR
ncbi:GNAT family N-acetyltransferase [Alteromonas sp. a30]|uniref:GNAT family N-acetyltransferase n=1 Tax=Alteromonas sp. a30 TaxID=2730917 RepID=UPI00227E30F2|nr:GNAT family protein [Alteromonas sp. a30]MCY7296663.1 GNAT family N-acetyltransferase [Alteromonas sp. a30]